MEANHLLEWGKISVDYNDSRVLVNDQYGDVLEPFCARNQLRRPCKEAHFILHRVKEQTLSRAILPTMLDALERLFSTQDKTQVLFELLSQGIHVGVGSKPPKESYYFN